MGDAFSVPFILSCWNLSEIYFTSNNAHHPYHNKDRGAIFCLEYPSRRSEKVNFYFANYRFSFRKLPDFHFASYRFSFRFVPFRFASFRFAPFLFANYSKPIYQYAEASISDCITPCCESYLMAGI